MECNRGTTERTSLRLPIPTAACLTLPFDACYARHATSRDVCPMRSSALSRHGSARDSIVARCDN